MANLIGPSDSIGDGMPGSGFPGFSDYLKNKGFSNERNILTILPDLEPIQQVKLDMALHQNALDGNTFSSDIALLKGDSDWKRKLLDVFSGNNKDPHLIHNLTGIIKRDINSHKNRLANRVTGSNDWHRAWIRVYEQWLKLLGEN